MSPKISLLVNSRVEGNENCGLSALISDLRFKSVDLNNFEILIKFDIGDELAVGVCKDLVHLPDYEDINFKYVFTERRRGYADLHCGYADLMPYVSSSSYIVGCIADDMRVIHEGWDELLLKTAGDRELFIIHPHKVQDQINIDNLEGTIHDESPFWSKQLIHLCQCNWWIYATDAWTTALEYWLLKYKCNLSLLTHVGIFRRKFNGLIDTPKNKERWAVRSEMFKFTTGDFFKRMVQLHVSP